MRQRVTSSAARGDSTSCTSRCGDDGRRAFELTLARLQGEAARGDWPDESRKELYARLDDAVRDRPGRGEFGGGPGTPVFDAYAEFLHPGTADNSKYAPPVSEIAERYLQDRGRDPDAKVTDQTMNREKAVLELFGAWHRGPLSKSLDRSRPRSWTPRGSRPTVGQVAGEADQHTGPAPRAVPNRPRGRPE
jgi:hypothetical protein